MRCGYSPVDVPSSVAGGQEGRLDASGLPRPPRWSMIGSTESRQHILLQVGLSFYLIYLSFLFCLRLCDNMICLVCILVSAWFPLFTTIVNLGLPCLHLCVNLICPVYIFVLTWFILFISWHHPCFPLFAFLLCKPGFLCLNLCIKLVYLTIYIIVSAWLPLCISLCQLGFPC